jgi:hypothetical protein
MVLDVGHRNIVEAGNGFEGHLQRPGLCVGRGYQQKFDPALELESLLCRQIQQVLIPPRLNVSQLSGGNRRLGSYADSFLVWCGAGRE